MFKEWDSSFWSRGRQNMRYIFTGVYEARRRKYLESKGYCAVPGLLTCWHNLFAGEYRCGLWPAMEELWSHLGILCDQHFSCTFLLLASASSKEVKDSVYSKRRRESPGYFFNIKFVQSFSDTYLSYIIAHRTFVAVGFDRCCLKLEARIYCLLSTYIFSSLSFNNKC